MTPKSLLLAALAALTFVGAAASARPNPPPYPGPGHPGPGPGHPGPGHPGPGPGPHPGPGPGPHPGPQPQPPPPGPGPGQGYYSRTIYVNRIVTNMAFDLRQLADLDRSARGMIIDSVRVDVRPTNYRADLRLAVNNNLESIAQDVSWGVTLYPRSQARVGYDLGSLRLDVLGTLQIDQIVVNLRDGGYNPPPQPGPDLSVPVSIYRTMPNGSRLDLNQYMNLGAYRGYRVNSIEIVARSLYNAALLDVLVNSFQAGTMQLSPNSTRSVIYTNGQIIGQGFDNVMLSARGDVAVDTVTLRLSRY